MNRFSRLACAVSALAAVGGVTGTAHAFEAFSTKEGKPCAYCHVNAKGSGPRNYRGVFYKQNALSFAKFDDAAEAKKAGVEIGPEPTPPPKSYTPADKAAEPAAGETKEEPKKAESADGGQAKPGGGTTVAQGQGPSVEPPRPATASPTMTVPQAKANLKAAEALYKKTPNNAARKQAYAQALAHLGHSTMLDQSIPPRQRYPEALNLLRRALALDPKNKMALADRKQIEDVYKGMGRPVPK